MGGGVLFALQREDLGPRRAGQHHDPSFLIYIKTEHLSDYFAGPVLTDDDVDLLNAKIKAVGLFKLYGYESPWKQWTLSVYWGFQSLTFLGYSDFMPETMAEVAWAEVVCCLQVVRS